MKTRIVSAIESGAKFLETTQNEDGGFTSFIDSNRVDFLEKNPVKTILNPALILQCLFHVESLKSNSMVNRLEQFLLSQRESDYTYNYWSKDSPNRKSRYCPNDLDDTFCAYVALHLISPSNSTAEVLVGATKALISTEIKAGGPYRTWVVGTDSEEAWLDVDIAVNSNIARYLNLVARVPKNLREYLENAIKNYNFKSPYYPGKLSVLYYLSSLPITNIHECAKYLPAYSPSVSSLDAATIATILLNLGMHNECKPFIEHVLTSQLKDGSWDAGGFSVDRIEGPTTYFSGCKALTTAIAMEALARYLNVSDRNQSDCLANDSYATTIQKYTDSSNNTADKQAKIISQTLKSYIDEIAQSNNGKEILLGSSILNNSLRQKPENTEHDLELGTANLFGWIAYTIYDDIIDEQTNTSLLPVANVAHRISLAKFLNVAPDDASKQYVRDAFDKIDVANAVELKNFRALVSANSIIIDDFPDYSNLSVLAEKSIGHTLPLLLSLVDAGYSVDSKKFSLLEHALQNYLIAKQLNDDAHDWQDDLLSGNMTYVVTILLRDLCLPFGSYNKNSLIEIAQIRFWYKTVLEICNIIESHISSGEKALKESGLFQPESEIYDLFNSLHKTLQTTRTEQKTTIAFLEGFK